MPDNPEYSTKVPETPQTPKETEKFEKIPASGVKPEAESLPKDDGTPLGVEHFGIKYWPEIILTPALDWYKTVDKVMFIEDFIKDRIKDQGLKNDKESYLAIVKSMEDELGLTPQHESHIRVDKIFNLLRIMKNSSYDKEKKRIISLLKTQK